MAESGYPEYGVSVWYGVSAQAKLPDDIAEKTHRQSEQGAER